MRGVRVPGIVGRDLASRRRSSFRAESRNLDIRIRMSRAELAESAENTEGIRREARGIQIGEPAERARLNIDFSVLSVNSARGV